MTEIERKEAYRKFLDKWGYEAQMMMCIEEMSELTKEFCKYERKGQNDDEVREHIIEELADVLNTVEQMAMIFGEERVRQVQDEKINRCIKRAGL